jgi:hypothetical protein
MNIFPLNNGKCYITSRIDSSIVCGYLLANMERKLNLKERMVEGHWTYCAHDNGCSFFIFLCSLYLSVCSDSERWTNSVITTHRKQWNLIQRNTFRVKGESTRDCRPDLISWGDMFHSFILYLSREEQTCLKLCRVFLKHPVLHWTAKKLAVPTHTQCCLMPLLVRVWILEYCCRWRHSSVMRELYCPVFSVVFHIPWEKNYVHNIYINNLWRCAVIGGSLRNR